MPYRTLDDRDVLEQATTDPEGFLSGLGDGGSIDEAQRAPGLFLAIKAVVDRTQQPGQYLLSGSNQPTMAGAVGDSLLGRAAYRTLRPLTLGELRFDEEHHGWSFLLQEDTATVLQTLEERAAASGPLDWRALATTGGFPRAVAAPPDMRRRVLDDYVRVFASRDIREILAIESAGRFEQFLRLTATRTGQVLNVSGLSSDLGIPVTTVRRWLDALERTFLIERVPAYSRNAGQRVIKSPKLFMTDVALALASANETEPSGFHLETLVASDIAVWKDAAPGRAVHYWRTQSGQEVDFVVQQDQRTVAIEIKSNTRVNAGDARHLRAFRDQHRETVRAVLLSSDDSIRELSDGVVAAPWWAVV
jgi:predicted AAA+ superfamily ATPase